MQQKNVFFPLKQTRDVLTNLTFFGQACIANDERCNGEDDCGDDSDENAATCDSDGYKIDKFEFEESSLFQNFQPQHLDWKFGSGETGRLKRGLVNLSKVLIVAVLAFFSLMLSTMPQMSVILLSNKCSFYYTTATTGSLVEIGAY